MVCSICNHPRRAEIEQACLLKDFGGESRSLSDIASEFKVNLRDLQVHVLTHIPLAESNAKDVEENESIASNIHKREADILRQVMEDSYVTFKNLSSKINTIVSAHTIDSPTMGQLTKPVTDLYLGMEKYQGKTVRFKGRVVTKHRSLKNCFVCGRHVMTCCAEDITFMGLACTGYSPEKLENGGWYTVTANVDIRFSTVYGKRGPVLAVTACVPAEEPEQEVATFY